jgi:hypothetical protein
MGAAGREPHPLARSRSRDLVAERTRIQNRLRRRLHDRWRELELPTGCLERIVWLQRLSARLSRCAQDADVAVMRHQVRRLRELVREACARTRALERERCGAAHGARRAQGDARGAEGIRRFFADIQDAAPDFS